MVRARPGRGVSDGLLLGPSNPALHTRPSRALRGRAAGSSTVGPLQPDTPPNHDDQLITGLRQQFGHRPRRRRRAYLAGEPTSTARITIPDELVPTASAARYELEALVHEPDQRAYDTGLKPASSPAEVKAHQRPAAGQQGRPASCVFIQQVCNQAEHAAGSLARAAVWWWWWSAGSSSGHGPLRTAVPGRGRGRGRRVRAEPALGDGDDEQGHNAGLSGRSCLARRRLYAGPAGRA
jgi:hypothetical protein